MREQIELVQPYPKVSVFTHVVTTNDSEDIIDISKEMRECNKIQILIDNADVYLRFLERDDEVNVAERITDSVNHVASLLLIAGAGYFDTNIQLEGRIVVIKANPDATEVPRIRGICWGR